MATPKTQPNRDAEVAAILGAEILVEGNAEDSAKATADYVEPEIAAPAQLPTSVAEPKPRRSGGFFGLFLGGVTAAALGFGLARYIVPDGWPMTSTIKLETLVSKQAVVIATLGQDLAGLKADLASRPTMDPAIARQLVNMEAAIDEVKNALASLQEGDGVPALEPRIATLERRLDNLELLPPSVGGVSPLTISALAGDLSAIKAEVAAQRAALTSNAAAVAEASSAQIAEVQASIKVAAVKAALAQMQGALQSGVPFAPALAELEAYGHAVPHVLLEMADAGAPTLVSLQDSFPQAARAALDASLRAGSGESMTDRFSAFLRAQTGARSLAPRGGADPDAILSRAEAALQTGDLIIALSELRAIPPDGQAAMAEWVTEANRRMQAIDALNALMATLAKE
ncbi:MAG: hypothetical protein WCC57_00970 [Paracoccaceae bacterium]